MAKGYAYLKRKLQIKRERVMIRYKYYDMKHNVLDPGQMIPIALKSQFNSVIGWCSNSVDSLADRIVFDEFKNDNFDLNSIFEQNNADVFFDSAILSALISSCCFIYISRGLSDEPRLQVIDGSNATGEIDPVTGMLLEGYAVLKRDTETQVATMDAYFSPGITTVFDRLNHTKTNYMYNSNYPMLVPITFRPDATRPFGHSRISRACMNIQDKARHVLTRSDISAEFYSFPQKYIVGLSEDSEPLDSWKATISSMLSFTKDEDGDSPTLGQFTQQSIEPHISQLKMYASMFAGETGLTLDDLGFATENPSSAEAIKAAHENLRLTARKAQRTFGSGFLNTGFLAACVRDNFTYNRKELYRTKPTWKPIFEPDAATMSGVGDAAIKINQAIPGYFDFDNLKELTGIEGGIDEGPATGTTEEDKK